MEMPLTQNHQEWLGEKNTLENASTPFLLPFPSSFSFEPLLRSIEQTAQGQHGTTFVAEEILRRIEKARELRGPIADLSVLADHQELVDLMLSFLILFLFLYVLPSFNLLITYFNQLIIKHGGF